MIKIIISLFLLGLSFGSGPCIAGCGPILISYIAGTKKNITKSILAYLLFSLARIIVYLGLSLLIFFLGRFLVEGALGSSYKYVRLAGGLFIVLIGLLMALDRRIEFKALRALQKNILESDKKSIFTLGLVLGLAPCAPFLVILSYIGMISKSWLHSLFYSFSFGLGTFVSPLLLLVILAGLIPKWLQNENYYRLFSLICGLIIMFLGAQLILGAF